MPQKALAECFQTQGGFMSVPTGRNATQWGTAFPVPAGWMRQFQYFIWLYDKIRKVPGDVVECGLGEGITFAMLAFLAGSDSATRKLWGFDSFEGWPEPTQWDASPRNPQAGEWQVDERMVLDRLEGSDIHKAAFPDLEIKIIGGFLRNTLPSFRPGQKIAFLHLDLDLYEGYHDALLHLFPKVAVGGVVAFDEYMEFPNYPEYDHGAIEKWPGCTKAVNDYFADRPEEILFYPPTKKYYVVKAAS